MTQVDPDDDEIERFVVHRYAFDPVRRERRHIVVVAFDNHHEFEAAIAVLVDELDQRRSADAGTDPQEHISGVVLDPGHRRKQRNGRTVHRAIEHGVTLTDATWDHLVRDSPSNVVVTRAASNPQA